MVQDANIDSCVLDGTIAIMQTDQTQLSTHSAADIDLVRSAKRGDMAAFEELVRRHTKRVFAIARHITRSHQEAEDVSQETFLKAFLHLNAFEEKAQFSTWLTRIAMNAALAVARSSRVKTTSAEVPEWETSSAPDEVSEWRANPEQLYSRSQLRQLLQQALEELPQAYSAVFLLRDVQGLSILETAAALQLNVPTVKTRLLRARLRLRQNLSKTFITTWTSAEHARSNLVSRV
jgi:RNA polymerase sigma-70 factor (ECF subfamily)